MYYLKYLKLSPYIENFPVGVDDQTQGKLKP